MFQGRLGSISETPSLGRRGRPALLVYGKPLFPPGGCWGGDAYWKEGASPASMTGHRSGAHCPTHECLFHPRVGEALGVGAMPAAAFLGREEGGRERGRAASSWPLLFLKKATCC